MYTATCDLQSSTIAKGAPDRVNRAKSQASNAGSSCGDQTSFLDPVMHELLARDDQNPPRCDIYRALELQNEQGSSL